MSLKVHNRILIVGGTDVSTEAGELHPFPPTMVNFWDPYMHVRKDHLRVDSSNFSNYGRNRFPDLMKIPERCKGKYNLILFEFCPIGIILRDYGLDNMILKTEELSVNSNPVLAFPVHFNDYEYDLSLDPIDYDPALVQIISFCSHRGYNIYRNISFTEVQSLFTSVIADVTKRTFDRFVIISKDELPFKDRNVKILFRRKFSFLFTNRNEIEKEGYTISQKQMFQKQFSGEWEKISKEWKNFFTQKKQKKNKTDK